MLHEFVAAHREEIIRRCRAKVAPRSVPPATTVEIEHGVPVFLQQLVEGLRLQRASHPEIGTSGALHGHDLLRQGFTVSQVVHDYEQRGADRTGVGLGLAFSRWAVQANHGRIATRNLPGKGCVLRSTSRGTHSLLAVTEGTRQRAAPLMVRRGPTETAPSAASSAPT